MVQLGSYIQAPCLIGFIGPSTEPKSVLDLFDRQSISHIIGTSPNVALSSTSLRDALSTLEPGQQPLVHSDQGFQYRHASWRALLQEASAVHSMSRKGNCYDNAVIENFFGHLKK